MRLAPFAATAIAVGMAGALAHGSSGAATNTAGCTNKTVTVGGATVVVHCGPATATFTFAGKTYRVSGGKCVAEKSLGITAWSANVGRQTLPPAKPLYPDFHATFVGAPKAGAFTHGEYVLSFAVPGKAAWSIAPGLPHKVKVTAGARSGTFSGRFYTGSQGGTKPAIGTWRC
jgi:hypothetical protein